MNRHLIALATYLLLVSTACFAGNVTLNLKNGQTVTGLKLMSVTVDTSTDGTASLQLVTTLDSNPQKYVDITVTGYSIAEAAALQSAAGGGVIKAVAQTHYVYPATIFFTGVQATQSLVPGRDVYAGKKTDTTVSITRLTPAQ